LVKLIHLLADALVREQLARQPPPPKNRAKDFPSEAIIAVPVRRAAEMVGVSRAQFYKVWVHGGLVKLIDVGARGKSVRVDDLRAVVADRQSAVAKGEAGLKLRQRSRRRAEIAPNRRGKSMGA